MDPSIKVLATPWLLLKCMMEGGSCADNSETLLISFAGGKRAGSGEQMFALANLDSEHRVRRPNQGIVHCRRPDRSMAECHR